MSSSIIGIEGSVGFGVIADILTYYSKQYDKFYISHCLKIDDKNMIMPKSKKDFTVNGQGLRDLTKNSIWEIVMYIYPPEVQGQELETYDEYLYSDCLLCLIYYDCGSLEIYSKDESHVFEMQERLLVLNAHELILLTEDNYGRTAMHL